MFDSDEGFAAAAVDFLRSGLHKERLLYIADRGTTAELYDDLIELGDAELLADEGDLVVGTAAESYLMGETIDPVRQVQSYRALVDVALADGFAGLRVAADATSLVCRDDQRRAFMSYEIAVDALMRTAPMRALCGYDSRVLEDRSLDLACVHREFKGKDRYTPGFWVSTADNPAATMAVSGEIDASNADRFAAALDAAADALPLLPAVSDDQVVLDARGLDFIDSEGATALLSFIENVGPERSVVVSEPPRSLVAVVDSMGWGDRIHYARRGEGG